MKTILMLFLFAVSSMFLHVSDADNRDGVMSIYGEWREKKNQIDSAQLKLIFFPGGKVNVIRNRHNYIGYFKIHNDQTDYVEGSITLADQYPFTATFIAPNEIKLVIKDGDKAKTKYLAKTKEIKSGFQLLDKAL